MEFEEKAIGMQWKRWTKLRGPENASARVFRSSAVLSRVFRSLDLRTYFSWAEFALTAFSVDLISQSWSCTVENMLSERSRTRTLMPGPPGYVAASRDVLLAYSLS